MAVAPVPESAPADEEEMTEPIFRPVLKHLAHSNSVRVKLETEMVEAFYRMCAETGLSPNALAVQSIKFAMSHYQPPEKPDGA